MALWKMKKDTQSKNCNENSTMEKNIVHHLYNLINQPSITILSWKIHTYQESFSSILARKSTQNWIFTGSQISKYKDSAFSLKEFSLKSFNWHWIITTLAWTFSNVKSQYTDILTNTNVKKSISNKNKN